MPPHGHGSRKRSATSDRHQVEQHSDQSEALRWSTFTSVTKIDYRNIRSEYHIKDLCSRRLTLTCLRYIPSSSQQANHQHNTFFHQPTLITSTQSVNRLNSITINPTNPTHITMSSTTGAVPITCCGRDGGCICAQEAKCSCGKQPALQCTCEKSSTENKTSGARCSCSKSSPVPHINNINKSHQLGHTYCTYIQYTSKKTHKL